ncbi:MAG: hypothetical protein ACI906_003124 [Candidatus Latescibacterota bacterium]|jgi:hypothetical protein
MVMDIRHLLVGDAQAKEVDEVKEVAPGIGEWLSECAEASDLAARARTLLQLRLSVPSEEGIELLRDIVADVEDVRRLLAAQMLGHHRIWLAKAAGVRRQVALAGEEKDPVVAAVLVWGLHQCDEAAEFIGHTDSRVAREAVLATPISRRTLSPILAALREERRPEVERILLHKMHQIHPSLVRYLVDLLVEGSWGDEALRGLFASLPQMPLFELFLDGRQPAAWALGDAERSRFWQRLVRLVSSVLVECPGTELMRYLLSRSGDDESFARRHAQLLRAAVQRTDADLGAALVGHVERLTFGATEDKVIRLAQALVDLSVRLEGDAASKVNSLLEEWKSRSADLKLKIYHLEQGIG